jgi:prepilin-type processing-associated H-X9-DG protein
MRKRTAFTLVDLVVIGIIALLIAVLLPALSRVQKQARMTKCLSNQRQLISALLMYTQDNKGMFPGGPGFANYNGVNTFFHGLASWDTNAQNPYSCNQDLNSGPTFLAKYVSNSTKIPACPEEPEIKETGSDFSNYRTSYWYPMSLVYRPDQIFNPSAFIGPATDQVPQKLTAVRYSTQKAVIIDRKTYHDRIVYDTDRKPPWLGPTYQNKRYVTVGFADGHAAFLNVADMLDPDVNWTGRGTEAPGVKGRDFP